MLLVAQKKELISYRYSGKARVGEAESARIFADLRSEGQEVTSAFHIVSLHNI